MLVATGLNPDRSTIFAQSHVTAHAEALTAHATIESGKWVGPVPSPVNGDIIAVNEALAGNPTLVNSDPYGDGWVIRIKATIWSVQRSELHTGPHAVDSYRVFLETEGIACE